MRRALIYEGYSVDVAADGDAALASARDQRPDLVVLDVMLPGLDGIEVCQRLRAAAQPGSVLRWQDLSMDLAAHEVTRGNRAIELTAQEFKLLEQFLRHPRQVLSRDSLLELAWGFVPDESNVVDVYVGYLRHKLEADGEPRVLQTVRGVGYVLRSA